MIEEGTVIQATHRSEDLIPAFYAELRRRDYIRLRQLIRDHSDTFDAILESRINYQGDDAIELVDALEDELSEVAPEGMYFGAHPGDGSDFGFWRNEEED